MNGKCPCTQWGRRCPQAGSAQLVSRTARVCGSWCVCVCVRVGWGEVQGVGAALLLVSSWEGLGWVGMQKLSYGQGGVCHLFIKTRGWRGGGERGTVRYKENSAAAASCLLLGALPCAPQDPRGSHTKAAPHGPFWYCCAPRQHAAAGLPPWRQHQGSSVQGLPSKGGAPTRSLLFSCVCASSESKYSDLRRPGACQILLEALLSAATWVATSLRYSSRALAASSYLPSAIAASMATTSLSMTEWVICSKICCWKCCASE